MNRIGHIIHENFPQIKSIHIGEPKGYYEVATAKDSKSEPVVKKFFHQILTSAGIKREGEIQDYFAETKEQAWDDYHKEFSKFLEEEIKNKEGTYQVVLRKVPELLEDVERMGYRVYSRLLVWEVPQDEK